MALLLTALGTSLPQPPVAATSSRPQFVASSVPHRAGVAASIISSSRRHPARLTPALRQQSRQVVVASTPPCLPRASCTGLRAVPAVMHMRLLLRLACCLRATWRSRVWAASRFASAASTRRRPACSHRRTSSSQGHCQLAVARRQEGVPRQQRAQQEVALLRHGRALLPSARALPPAKQGWDSSRATSGTASLDRFC